MLPALLPAALALVPTLQGPPSDDPDAPFLRGQVEVEGHTYAYRLLAPPAVAPEQRYPIVLFLHGAGERGEDNAKQLTHFPRRMLSPANRADFPCFVLAPQCPPGERWSSAPWGDRSSTPLASEPTRALRAAMEALLEVVREQPVDTDRVYLTGLSMGGYGAVDLALRRPDWFAAVAPVCGGGDEREVARLAGLPLSFWHGDRDEAVPVERSRQLVEALRALGEEPAYRELPGVGHDAWNHAYAEDGCLRWLFAQRREPARRLAAAARLMAEAAAPTERIAFLGDSITQGGARPGGYVDLLRRALAERRPEAAVIPAGISGNKIADLLGRCERDVVAHEPSLVFVYIGINDVWHSQNGRGTPRADFAPGLERLCGALEAGGRTRVVLATASVIGERPAGENALDEMLADFVDLTRGVAAAPQRTLCDLHAAFRDQLELLNPTGAAKGVLTSDGVHLNEAGNVFVATQAARALRRALLAREGG